MTLPAARSVLVGGRYRLDRRLGEGGMGVVWAATHAESGRSVALKMLKPHARARADLQRRLVREAQAAAAVRHPNVVAIHEMFNSDADGPVIVMDLLEGETLRAKLAREERLSIEETATILLPVVSAVAAAHAQGIVHRDLKPDNIFLRSDVEGALRTQVLDFGIAKLVLGTPDAMDSSALTSTGAMIGTPWYMAPEQGFGERDIDARADVWALGVILYESLSGGRPVEGDNLGQVLKRLTNQGITPLSRVAPDVPADLADLVDQMLVTERDERLVDLSRVRNVLGRYARGGRDAFVGPVTPKRARRGALAAAGVFLSATVAIGAAWALHGPHRRGVAEVAPVPTPHPITTTQVATDSRSGPEAAPALAEGRAAAIDPSRAPPAQRPAPSGTAPHRLHGRTAPSAAPSSVSPAPTASTILGGLVARPPF